MEALRKPIENAYWVVEGQFLAGEYPSGSDGRAIERLQAFLDCGFVAFFDLTIPGELPSYRELLLTMAKQRMQRVECYSFPIPDFGVPSKQEMLRLLERLNATLRRGVRTYLHCWGGVGRTGTVIGCYFVQQGMKGDEALQELHRRWQTVPKSQKYPRSPETEAQRRFVLEFAGEM